ncbi:MAG: GWxTD domain-containing protein [Bacteroidales bacterium]
MRRLIALVMFVSTVSVLAQSVAVSDRDWKRWLNDVGPLLTAAEKTQSKKVPVEERDSFREAFWARRNPNRDGLENPTRTDFELRVRQADKRFRHDGAGAWNDCGYAFVVLGKPDKVANRVGTTHFSGDDPLKAFREQDDVVAEAWQYRTPARLPPTPEGYNFRFTQTCQSLNGPGFQRLMQSAAATYVVAR